jgi:hypothetical protein
MFQIAISAPLKRLIASECPIALEQFRYTTAELAGQSGPTLDSAGMICAVGLERQRPQAQRACSVTRYECLRL